VIRVPRPSRPAARCRSRAAAALTAPALTAPAPSRPAPSAPVLVKTVLVKTVLVKTVLVKTVLAMIVLAMIVLAAVGGAAAAPRAWAAPEPMSRCSTTTGVVMAVSFAHWGGPLLRSCASTPTTAYDMLNQGGWHSTGTEHDGPGFICRIGYGGYQGGTQYPTPAQESCVLTPPSSAYWTFWHAGPGQNTWAYSQTGATGYSPSPGSVELWVFGGTNIGGTSGSAVPTVSPASLRANNQAPGSAVRSKNPAHPGAHPAHPAARSAHQAAGPARSTRPGGGTATTSAPASRSARAGASSSPVISNAPPVAASDSQPSGHGSAVPAIIALVIVVLLAAGGITAALRRPRRAR
jgi:hypothetical protein